MRVAPLIALVALVGSGARAAELPAPVPPRHLLVNIYYVGASGVSSYLITMLAGQFAMVEKFAKLDDAAKPNPFIDPDGWRKLIAGAEKAFRGQLAAETAEVRR